VGSVGAQLFINFLETMMATVQRTNTENSEQIFPEKELRGHRPNFHIHVSVSDLYLPTIDLPILLRERCGPILGMRHMNVEIGTEAAQLPDKEIHKWNLRCST
jgi:hypothetical protein